MGEGLCIATCHFQAGFVPNELAQEFQFPEMFGPRNCHKGLLMSIIKVQNVHAAKGTSNPITTAS